jgi:hypothetical protein
MCMNHGTYTFEQFLMYGLALALAIAVAFTPSRASSGTFTTDPVKRAGPRWSNDQHHEYGLIVRPDCVALPPGADAQYVPGRDPWGRPVIPAEPPKGFNESFPVEIDLDVNLGTKHIAGKEIELHAGRFAFDPATNELTLNGRRWQRDCLPSPK